jgi:outer membrane receptor protein involved in Fe transport
MGNMKKFDLLAATAVALVSVAAASVPAYAQSTPQADDSADDSGEIIVTAQRQAQTLQEVPIAVSAFSAEALEKQQIENASDLQLTLPNVTFTKGNFTGSSFTIRGIGDLCVGTACDSATGIHLNGSPLLGTRLFETEYFDLERIEVLRGPQGTLFGRNATSGVVNFVTAKPDASGFKASGEAEYGNYNSIKVKGMVNVPLGDTLAVRAAGFYLKRDGYTTNLFTGNDIDDREMYAVRGSLAWEPTDSTRIELLGYYFREKDSRARIQKQLCQRDPTGVLGCLNNRRDFAAANTNATFTGVLSSREFLAANGIPAAFGLGSLYGPDGNALTVNPANVRQVSTDFDPEYFTSEQQYQARLEQEFGSLKVQLTGLYQKSQVFSRQDYLLNVADRTVSAPALQTLAAAAAGLAPPLPAAFFQPLAAAIIPDGPTGRLCTSDTDSPDTGAFGGNRVCANSPLDLDRSSTSGRNWSVEGIVSSDFDGPFNFLLGGIYVDGKARDTDYYVNSFAIDYVTGLLGTFNALGRQGLAAIPGATPPPPGYLGTSYFRNNTPSFTLKSYGIFGEAYWDISDRMKLTLGGRYNNDKKALSARSTLANFLTPFNATSVFSSPFRYGYAVTGAPAASRLAPFDADPSTPCAITSTTASGILTAANVSGCEDFQVRNVKYDEITGRAVLDYKITDDNLLYVSFSRGYKSGGINPPLQPVFAVPTTFDPEIVNAFEIGSKNVFANGKLVLNATAFYYKYKSLQLSRIVARTSVNDNVDADIYGLELESIIRPSRELAINMGFSYLHTKVSEDKLLGNPRDPSGGRSDAVIIKDITNGSNCAVASASGSVAGINGFVNQVNALINSGAVTGNAGAGLQPTAPFPSDSGVSANGAFSICAALNALAPTVGVAFGGVQIAEVVGGVNQYTFNAGIPVNIRGNKLPQAPNYKFSIGAQYTAELSNGMSIVPRIDLTYTGDSYGNIFNGRVNKINGYAQSNAQLQVNGRDERWFVRGFIQNIFNNNATTGLYVTDQSSGLFTNIFTLEPRRYGIAAGFKF